MKINKFVSLLFLAFYSPFIYGQDCEGQMFVDANILFCKALGVDRLHFRELQIGDRIELNNVIVMPHVDEGGFASIEIDRSYLTNELIHKIFFEPKSNNVREQHLFQIEGFEPILMDKKLILNIHSGVIFNLRNDLYSDPNFRSFNDGFYGVVREVRGTISISQDSELISRKLNKQYAFFDGTVKERSRDGQEVTKVILKRPNQYDARVVHQ